MSANSTKNGRFGPARRVVVTGVGMISALGHDLESSWQAMLAGKSGSRRVTHFDPTDYPTQFAARVDDWDPNLYLDRKEARRVSRGTQFALKASQDAMRQAGLQMEETDPTRVGVEIGMGFGGWEIVEEQTLIHETKGPRRFNPALLLGALTSGAPTQVAIHFGAKGPTNSPVAACATGIVALGEAARRIQYGQADVMIAGSADGYLTPLVLTTFSRLGAASTNNDDPEHACKPFSADRDGMVVAEGAGVFVLESMEHAQRRGATILAEFAGYGLTEDAYDATAPDPSGEGAAKAMQLALEESLLAPQNFDWIIAHGTGTHLNDSMETAAIKRVFGEAAYNIPVTSIKSMIGHAMGAAGAQSAVTVVKAMAEGYIVPTINYTTPDPECDLDYVTTGARPHQIDVALCNGFGMGGQNASLILKRYRGE
ncbi:MAG: beta-ketoacyl-ACP synthase II [Caldilineaceae bacterium]|nr:beta-ketoacyl-ACP synthase II [Caldilineaceae bacterium]